MTPSVGSVLLDTQRPVLEVISTALAVVIDSKTSKLAVYGFSVGGFIFSGCCVVI